MAKNIKRQNTGKKSEFKAVIDGKEVVAQTVKTCVGENIEKSAKCKKCTQLRNGKMSKTAQVCLALSQNAKESKKVESKKSTSKVDSKKKSTVKKADNKKAVRRSAKPFDCGIELWLAGNSKEQVIAYLIDEKQMKESAAKRFANDIFSVGKAAIGQARKKDGLIARYAEWALYSDRKKDAPTGCKVTLGFMRPYCEAFKAFTI